MNLLKSIFKFRNKEEKIGILLGSICFMPSFIISVVTGIIKHNILIGVGIMWITQFLWLTSIAMCNNSLEIENRKLKEQLKNREDN